ncbi:unnamed protein product [Bodo saltans]|uniref:Uncharacterized protein n=1 Tax=Bodo saltans TaxID=75058 RepID=A0A0S4J0U6_BODSA|nr:unnamed protein product [Bodo saltans]|eukprot:CUG76017.1 unnamed protein product [Bodo saltans]
MATKKAAKKAKSTKGKNRSKQEVAPIVQKLAEEQSRKVTKVKKPIKQRVIPPVVHVLDDEEEEEQELDEVSSDDIRFKRHRHDRHHVMKRRRQERYSSSESDASYYSSDSDCTSRDSYDGFEEDLSILKPLVPTRWKTSRTRFMRSLVDLEHDIERADPRRPVFLVEEFRMLKTLCVATQHDWTRSKSRRDSDDPPTAVARLFQYLAAAYVRAHGGSPAELKASIGKLRREERRSGRRLIEAVRKVMAKSPMQHQVSSSKQSFRKKQRTFPTNSNSINSGNNQAPKNESPHVPKAPTAGAGGKI